MSAPESSPLRVGLETSITRFIHSGLAVYARQLARALAQESTRIALVSLDLPAWMNHPPSPLMRKAMAAYWHTLHPRIAVPGAVQSGRCDLAHFTFCQGMPSRLDVPMVVTIHDMIPFLHPEWTPRVRGHQLRTHLERAARNAAHIITISEASRQDLERHFGLPPSRVSVTPLGPGEALPAATPADAARLVRSRFGVEPGFALCVSSLEPRKNLAGAIRAFGRRPAPSRMGRKLVIVGADSYQAAELRRTIAESGAGQDIILTGHLPSDELAALFATAGVFVFPSLYEGFGLPVLEAMRAGCPVVASDTSSLPEVAGDAALLVNPRDEAALADAVWRVLDDPAQADRLREAGLARARLFTWERCARMTCEAYRRALGSG